METLQRPNPDEAYVLAHAMPVSNEDPQLRPRRRDPFIGVDECEGDTAFLQHDLHAVPLFKHFLDNFHVRLPAPLLSQAVHLVVHSRID